MINQYEGRVERVSRADSYAWVRLKRGRLAVRLWKGIRQGERVVLKVRPEDVVLCAEHPGLISARNILPGRVEEVQLVPEGVYVTLNVGFSLTAIVTRRAIADMGIRRGMGLFALVKAIAVVPQVEVWPSVRVSIVGRQGLIPHQALDLLRAIDRTGSLTAGAREAGVTYRTAWLWVESANRSWGGELVTRTQGGKGGGGAVLTPTGRAVLEWAARLEEGARSPRGQAAGPRRWRRRTAGARHHDRE